VHDTRGGIKVIDINEKITSHFFEKEVNKDDVSEKWRIHCQ
jgi:hypothetical protein